MLRWNVARIFGTASLKLISIRWTVKIGIGNANSGLLYLLGVSAIEPDPYGPKMKESLSYPSLGSPENWPYRAFCSAVKKSTAIRLPRVDGKN